MGFLLMKIAVSAFDPSLANFGMARLSLDLQTLRFEVQALQLVQTEKKASKQVRQNSDDLRRARELAIAFQEFAALTKIGFAEVPTGAQSARAMYAFGVSVGLLAACPVPLIQVQPHETKLATVGTKTASKEEMIEWAVETYPEAPWLKHIRGGKEVVGNKNEHLADALAIAHAGVKTDQFQQLRAMWMAGAEAKGELLSVSI